jgi:hypothetical protein
MLFCIVHLYILAANKIFIIFYTLAFYVTNEFSNVWFIFSGLAFLPATAFSVLIVFEPINYGSTPDV